jgi:hypothetical protein
MAKTMSRSERIDEFLKSFGALPKDFVPKLNGLAKNYKCEAKITNYAQSFSENFQKNMLALLNDHLIITPEEYKEIQEWVEAHRKKLLNQSQNQNGNSSKSLGKVNTRSLIHHKYMKKYGDHSIHDYHGDDLQKEEENEELSMM